MRKQHRIAVRVKLYDLHNGLDPASSTVLDSVVDVVDRDQVQRCAGVIKQRRRAFQVELYDLHNGFDPASSAALVLAVGVVRDVAQRHESTLKHLSGYVAVVLDDLHQSLDPASSDALDLVVGDRGQCLTDMNLDTELLNTNWCAHIMTLRER